MSKTVTIRLDEAIYSELKEAAAAARRPLSNLIETAALQKIREEQFLDDAEMARILADEDLVTRLREGQLDIRAGRSQPVD